MEYRPKSGENSGQKKPYPTADTPEKIEEARIYANALQNPLVVEGMPDRVTDSRGRKITIGSGW